MRRGTSPLGSDIVRFIISPQKKNCFRFEDELARNEPLGAPSIYGAEYSSLADNTWDTHNCWNLDFSDCYSKSCDQTVNLKFSEPHSE